MLVTKIKKQVLDHSVLLLLKAPYYFKGNLQITNSKQVPHSVEDETSVDVEVPMLD